MKNGPNKVDTYQKKANCENKLIPLGAQCIVALVAIKVSLIKSCAGLYTKVLFTCCCRRQNFCPSLLQQCSIESIYSCKRLGWKFCLLQRWVNSALAMKHDFVFGCFGLFHDFLVLCTYNYFELWTSKLRPFEFTVAYDSTLYLSARMESSGALMTLIAPPVFSHGTYMTLLYASRN